MAEVDQLRREVADLRERMESVGRVVPDLVESVRALSGQAGAQTQEALAARRDIDRLTRAIDGPPHIDAMREGYRRGQDGPEPPKDALSQLWHTVLSGVVAPLRAFSEARTSTQVLVAVVAVVALVLFFGPEFVREVRGGG